MTDLDGELLTGTGVIEELCDDLPHDLGRFVVLDRVERRVGVRVLGLEDPTVFCPRLGNDLRPRLVDLAQAEVVSDVPEQAVRTGRPDTNRKAARSTTTRPRPTTST